MATARDFAAHFHALYFPEDENKERLRLRTQRLLYNSTGDVIIALYSEREQVQDFFEPEEITHLEMDKKIVHALWREEDEALEERLVNLINNFEEEVNRAKVEESIRGVFGRLAQRIEQNIDASKSAIRYNENLSEAIEERIEQLPDPKVFARSVKNFTKKWGADYISFSWGRGIGNLGDFGISEGDPKQRLLDYKHRLYIEQNSALRRAESEKVNVERFEVQMMDLTPPAGLYDTLKSVFKTVKTGGSESGDSFLLLKTHFITLEHDGFKYPMGEYLIDISFESASIKVYKDDHLDNEQNGYCHPHVSTDRYLCKGEMERHICECYENHDFLGMAIAALQILENYNPESPYLQLHYWPRS